MTKHLRAKRKPMGRPPTGNFQISVRLPAEVLRELDQQAKAQFMTKSQYIAKLVMTAAAK